MEKFKTGDDYCCGMWLILRLEGLGKCLSGVGRRHFPFMHNLFYCGGDEITGWVCGGEALMVRYSIFWIYEYLCNLVISMVIINTLLCNPISI